MMRVHLVQVFIINVGVGKVIPEEKETRREIKKSFWNFFFLNFVLSRESNYCEGRTLPLLRGVLEAETQQRGTSLNFPSAVPTHPSTKSPMLSRCPRKVRQWYCWLVSISDVFWTHTSARVCCNTQTKKQQKYSIKPGRKHSSCFYFLSPCLFRRLHQGSCNI